MLARHFTRQGGNFHDTTPISFIKAYGFYFREEDNSAKNDKNYPHAKISTFKVY